MINETLFKQAIKQANKQTTLENKLALEYFGIPFDQLDEDDKEIIIYGAADLMNKK